MEESKELAKFVESPSYRMKIIKKIHKDEDKAYKLRVQSVEKQRDQLVASRATEIARIENSRWETIAKTFQVNRTEGKIRVNNLVGTYSDIQGAEIKLLSGVKTVTKEKSKSRKHASLGGAAVGGIVGGVPGAVIGGSVLGKTRTKGTSVSNSYATCQHLGVMVRMCGNASEIVLISREVEQNSSAFTNAYQLAESIIARLEALQSTIVPTDYLLPDQEITVLDIDTKISSKNAELIAVTNDHPTYQLPKMYRTQNQMDLSDQDYLVYLQNQDNQRLSDKEQLKAATRTSNASNSEKVLGLPGTIIFWIVCAVALLLVLFSLLLKCVVPAILYLLIAVLICPPVIELINKKCFSVRLWIPIVTASVGMSFSFILLLILFSK